MVENYPMAGEMTSTIEFFENITPVTASGVAKKNTLSTLGVFKAKRIDGRPNVDDEGRLLDVAAVQYQARFNQTLFEKGGKLVIRDFDGDYNVTGPIQVMAGRNRYMVIKCTKRG